MKLKIKHLGLLLTDIDTKKRKVLIHEIDDVNDQFTGLDVEQHRLVGPLDLSRWISLNLLEEQEKESIKTPSHYDNSKGTLYKVAQERGWNPYLFDIVKRLERAEKKGVFDEDLEKSIAVIQLWKKERNENS